MYNLAPRFIAKIFTNFFTTLYNLVFAYVIPTSLGPSNFGIFELINSNTQHLTSIIGFGTNGAFFTKISQRPNDIGLINFYFKIIIIITLSYAVISLIGLNFLGEYELLDGQVYVYLGIIYGISLYVFNSVRETCDAYSITVKSEFSITIIKGLGLIIVMSLFYLDFLNITTLYLKELFIIFLLLIFCIYLIIKNFKKLYSFKTIITKTKKLKIEFWDYCNPLLVMTIFSSLVVIIERWILQNYGGSIEQGFYSLGLRISSLGLIVASALTSLLLREIAVSVKNNNISEVKYLLTRSIKSMYFLVGIISVFICCFSKEINFIVFDSQYEYATMSIAILALYPMHQVYGQYTGSYFLAAGQTKLLRNITVITSLLSLMFTWILVAPNDYYGYNLGSIGLSLSLVISNILSTNIRTYFITKKINYNFFYLVNHQIFILILLFAVIYSLKFILSFYIQSKLILVAVSFFIYLIIIGNLTLKITFLTGFKSVEIFKLIKQIVKR